MSYQVYVIAAYLVFAVVLLWDWVAPRIQLRQQMRATRLRASRAVAANGKPSSLPASADAGHDPLSRE